MAVICVFCKEPIDLPIRHKLMDVRMFMLKKIMKKHFFNKQQLLRSPLCDDCNKTLQNYYNCKADIASCNEDFLNYMDSSKKVNLYEALISLGRLKRFKNESIAVKVCRICFKASQDADYREVKSWDGPLAKMITLCLPEFNVGLTDHTYLCPECYSSLLQYNHFLSICLEVTKAKKRHLDDPDPLELTPDDLKEKRQKMSSKVVTEKIIAEPLPMTALLLPKKRGPGRPRKGEEVNKQVPKQKLPKKKSELILIKNIEKEKNYDKEVLRYECQVCSKVLSELPELNKHMGKHRKETKFLCRTCGYFCSDFKELKRHFVEHEKGMYRIIRDSEQDSQIAKNVQVLKDNILNQIEKKRKTSSTTEDSVLEETEQYECQICPGVFDNIELLRDHINGHRSGHNFKCWKCGQRTYNFEHFRQHFRTHGFTSIYKTKFTGDNCPPNKEKSKDDGEIPVSSSKSIITGVTCSTCKEILNNLEDYLDHSCASSSKPSSDISCTSCTQKFDTLDDYMDHSCRNKQQFGCGHCSKVFYSLDDLDEHNCNVAQNSVGVANKSKTIEVPSSPINTLLQGPPAKSLPMKSSDPDYECSYCLKSFTTVTALDTHSCTEDPENATVATEPQNIPEIKIENAANDSTDDIILLSDTCEIKTENSYKCGLCLSLFDTENELNGHVCPEKSVEAGDNANEDIGSEIKTEEIDLAATQKKALINKIANLFGVKIVEGSEKKTQNTSTKLKCDECGLKCLDENDLMFHFKYYCPRLRKCDLCSYKTSTIQKLEIHSLKAHNLVIFACLHCRFTTYMEENFNKHIPIHENTEKNKTLEKPNLEPNPSPNIILNYTDAVMEEKFNKHIPIHENSDKNKTSEKPNLKPNPSPNIILNYTDAVRMNMATLDPLARNSFDYPTKTNSTNFVAKMPDIVERDPLQIETPEETFNEDSNSSTLTSNTLHNDLLEDPLQNIESQTDNVTNDPFNEGSNSSTLTSNTLIHNDLLEDPLEDIELQTDNVTKDPLNSSILPEGGDTTEDLHMEEQEKEEQNSSKQLHETEATIVIDDDSDSEFVESRESRISDATTQVEEVYPVTSDQASKLISEGVPVLREASLLILPVQPPSEKIQMNSNVLSVPKDLDNSPNSTTFNNCTTTISNSENTLLRTNLLQNPPEISNEAACSTSIKENKPVRQYSRKRNSNDVKTAPKTNFDGKSEVPHSVNVAVEEKAGDSDGSSFFVTDDEDSNPAASLKGDVAAEDSFVISDDEENDSIKPSESKKNVEDSNSDVFNQLVLAQTEKNNLLTNKNGETVKGAVTDEKTSSEEPKNNVVLSNDEKVRSRSGSASSVELSRDFSKEVEEEGGRQTDEDSEDDCVFVSEENNLSQSKNIMSSSGSSQQVKHIRKNTFSSNDNNPNLIKRPPNAMQIFITKAKSEMEKKHPNLPWGKQKMIIMNAWKALTETQKWPFKEEARLHRVLFNREHPELDKRKKKLQPVPLGQDIQEIILD